MLSTYVGWIRAWVLYFVEELVVGASNNLRNSLWVVQAAKDLAIGWYGTQIGEYFSKGTHALRLKNSYKSWYKINYSIVAHLKSNNLLVIAVITVILLKILNLLI